MRGDNREISVLVQFPAEEVLELETHHGAAWQPERKAETYP